MVEDIEKERKIESDLFCVHSFQNILNWVIPEIVFINKINLYIQNINTENAQLKIVVSYYKVMINKLVL